MSTKTVDEAFALLWRALPHVFKQQHWGKHAQDKLDAKELYPVIKKFLIAKSGRDD